MKLKLVSALARGQWAISEEAAYHYFPVAQAILAGTHAFDDEEQTADQDVQPVDAEEVEGQIATVRIVGPIMHYGGMCSLGAVDFAAMITAAADDPGVCAMLLDMNTPGGQVDGTEVWAAAVAYFAQQKPIIGYCESGVVASAGFWGWSYCTERYVGSEICRVGSIGIMAVLQDPRKAMEQEGIKQIVMYAPQSKDKNKTYQDALDGKPEAYIAELEFVCSRFISVVATNLEGQLTSDDWNTGKMFFAADAQQIGLINGIKTRSEVMARLNELAQTNQNSNTMFGNKFPALTALAGLAAGTVVTAEQVAAVNQQIEKQNIPGVTLALDSELQQYAAQGAELTRLTALVASQTSTIEAHVKSIAELQAKLDSKPAVAATAPAAATETTPPAATVVTAVASEETSVDRELAQLRALNQTF